MVEEKRIIADKIASLNSHGAKRSRMRSIVIEEVPGAIVVVYERVILLKDGERSTEERVADRSMITRVWSTGSNINNVEDTSNKEWLIISEHSSRG